MLYALLVGHSIDLANIKMANSTSPSEGRKTVSGSLISGPNGRVLSYYLGTRYNIDFTIPPKQYEEGYNLVDKALKVAESHFDETGEIPKAIRFSGDDLGKITILIRSDECIR